MGSHQRCAMASNLASSAGSTFGRGGGAHVGRHPRACLERFQASSELRPVQARELAFAQQLPPGDPDIAHQIAAAGEQHLRQRIERPAAWRVRRDRGSTDPPTCRPRGCRSRPSSPRAAAPPRVAASRTSRARSTGCSAAMWRVQREQLDLVPQILPGARAAPAEAHARGARGGERLDRRQALPRRKIGGEAQRDARRRRAAMSSSSCRPRGSRHATAVSAGVSSPRDSSRASGRMP